MPEQMKVVRALLLLSMLMTCMILFVGSLIGTIIVVKIASAAMIVLMVSLTGIDYPYWRSFYGKPTIIKADFQSDLPGEQPANHEGSTSDGQS